MTRTVPRRAVPLAVAVLVALPLVAAPVAALPASSAPGSAQAPAGTRSVTLLLASPEPAELTRLASTRTLSAAQRRAGLADALPSADQHRLVTTELAARGLSVVRSSPWSVTATGSAAAVDDLTGSLASRRSETTPAQASVDEPTAAVPDGALGSAVSAVVGGDDTAPVVHPLSQLTGTNFRTLYSAPGFSPQPGNSRLTVATLQFSGWDSSALTDYATAQSLPDPVSSGAYVGISVGGASTTAVDGVGDIEVALDQEALLTTAPEADQRAYFADNSIEGFVDGIERVAADASAHRIAALSISWGDCEEHWGRSNIAAVHTALKHALAAGVTVLASSGDSGSAACAGSSPSQTFDSVTYPASDPYVVSVGGTRVTSLANRTESAWSGSGGGSSAVFARPGFQHNAVPSRRARLVPDIAADADPGTGFAVTVGGTVVPVGGTSLSAPVSAALLVDTLATRGHEQGIGNVLARIYDAPSSAFRDITSGSNGHHAGVGYDRVTGRGSVLWSTLAPYLDVAPTLGAPAYTSSRNVALKVHVPAGVTYTAWRAGLGARPGSCSGLTAGAPPATVHTTRDGGRSVWVQGLTSTSACYSATAAVVVDTVRPKVATSLALTSGTSAAHVTARWRATDPGGSGARTSSVEVTRVGQAAPFAARTRSPANGSWRIASTQGRTYRVAVVVTDRAGNVSRAAVARATVPLDDSRFVRHGAWTRHGAPRAFGRAYRSSDERGATATATVTASKLTLLTSTCSTCGRAAVYVDGRRVRTIDLYSPGTHYRVRVPLGRRALGTHRVTVKVLAPSWHGSTVRVDALVATR